MNKNAPEETQPTFTEYVVTYMKKNRIPEKTHDEVSNYLNRNINLFRDLYFLETGTMTNSNRNQQFIENIKINYFEN